MKYAIHLVILAVVVSHFRVSSVSETNFAPTFPIHTSRLFRDRRQFPHPPAVVLSPKSAFNCFVCPQYWEFLIHSSEVE